MKKLLMMAALLASQCLAQKETPYFHLDFVIKEVEAGKVVSSRSYTTSVERGSTCAIRSGDRVPVVTVGSAGNTTYLDVGVSIDCNSVIVRDDNVVMHVAADVSSIGSRGTILRPPVVHQAKWSATVVVPIGKATTIFSSDGPSGANQTQLELTVTPIP